MNYSMQPSSSQGQNMPPVEPRKMWTPQLIAIVVGGTIVIGAAIYGAVWYSQKNQTPSNPIDTSNNYPINQGTAHPPKEGSYFVPPAPPTSNGYSAPVPNTAVQWNGEPKKIADAKLVLGYQDNYNSGLPNQDNTSYAYYLMGAHGSNAIILAIAPAVDIGGPALLWFEKKSDGKYIFMSKMSSYGVYGDNSTAGYLLSPIILSADTTTYYNGIVGPANLTWKGLSLEQPYLYPSDLFTNYVESYKATTGTATENITLKKVDSLPDGDLYLFQQPYYPSGTNQPDTTQKFYVRRYILKLKSGLYTAYNSRYAFFSDNLVPNITWLDGTKNQDSYRPEASLGGCGNPGAYVVSATDVSGMVKVSGTTGDGQSIYEFTDKNNPTEKFFYDLIDGKIYDYNNNSYTAIPYQEWASHHPVVFYKNALGEYAIFTDNKYGIAAECGKPVIYLYPTKPTNVKVQVGADITKSEPEYNNGWPTRSASGAVNTGWQVYAEPNGTLTTADGNVYESLFWEGTGYGMYPSITEGFVVPQAQIKIALVSELKDLGLNEKESADFLEFWLSKMPTTPYVRLTWFTVKQLDQLAPLIVLPKPDTIIRIFLDFQGLEKKISLPEQHLSTLPRSGFTVVEWGGLLRK